MTSLTLVVMTTQLTPRFFLCANVLMIKKSHLALLQVAAKNGVRISHIVAILANTEFTLDCQQSIISARQILPDSKCSSNTSQNIFPKVVSFYVYTSGIYALIKSLSKLQCEFHSSGEHIL